MYGPSSKVKATVPGTVHLSMTPPKGTTDLSVAFWALFAVGNAVENAARERAKVLMN